ncbi:MAG: putative solute-binding protein [Nannocystaceae bacterium]
MIPANSSPRRRGRRPLLRRLAASAAAVALGLVALGSAAVAQASADKKLCVFDPSGANGDLYRRMQDYQTAAAAWGVTFSLRPVLDESVAASDFENGQCDAVVLTGVTGQKYNPKTYTLEAMGLFTKYESLKRAIKTLALPKASVINKNRDFETVGVLPGGAVYLFLRDRGLSDVSQLAGRSIATIGTDKSARYMVNKIGATPKLASISNFASMFNNSSVDICYAPATAHDPLELWRGLGDDGGVVKFPISQLTFQIFIRSDEFPADFGQRSREYVSQQFDAMLRLVTSAEGKIKAWVPISDGDFQRYNTLLSTVRHELIKQGSYDATVVALGEKL